MSVVDVVGESPEMQPPDEAGDVLTLPVAQTDASVRAGDQRFSDAPKRLPMTPVLAGTVIAASVALGLAGWQITRAMNGDDRISSVTVLEIAMAALAALGMVTWTWIVVENARRLLSAAVSQNPLSPAAAAMSWVTPLIVATASVGTVAYLERRLNEPGFESTSPVPLAVACGALAVTLFVSYRPLFMLSAMMRRLGSGAGDLARWVWVPISLAIVGGFTLFGLRSGGAYGEDFEGVAPAWAVGVVFVPPLAIVLVIGWRGGRLVEEAIRLAYDRRNGIQSAGVGRGAIGVFARALRADARPPAHRDVRSRVRLAPGARIVRLAMMISVAALTLISVIGALVMFLFWREATDGALLPAQRERAWNALSGLQSLERYVALGATCVAAIWAFVSVLNARIASGRRRNPFLAAASWPAAAVAIWYLADRFDDDTEDIGRLVLRFLLQAAVLYVPFFLLERAAVAVGVRRSPLRLAYALGVVLLVHIQGLGGLATLVEETDVDRFGRIAGYLALAALLEMIATVAITESSRVIGDGAQSVAEKHNFLADQRAGIDERVAAAGPASPGPIVDDEPVDPSTSPRKPHGATVDDLVVGHDATPVDSGVPVPPRPDTATLVDAATTPAEAAAPAPVDDVPPPPVAAASAPVADVPSPTAPTTPVAAAASAPPAAAPPAAVPPAPVPVTDPVIATIPPIPAPPTPAAPPAPASAPEPSAAADDSFSIPKLVHHSVVSSLPAHNDDEATPPSPPATEGPAQ